MNKKFAVLFGAVLAGALFVTQIRAEDHEGEAGAGEPQMPQWMLKTDAHKKLAQSVGTFDVATEFWMAPGDPQKGKGVAKREMIMNGNYLQESFKMNFMGQPFEGRLTSGYDTVRGKFINTWIDNMSPVMSQQTGVEKDGMLIFTGDEPDHDGKLRKSKSTIEFKDNGWVMTAYHVEADGDKMHMRLTYTRQK